jgi:uncharacterized protein (DUF58 family)
MLAVSGAAIYSGNNLIYLVLSAMLATMLMSGLMSRLGLAGLSLRLALPDHLFARQAVSARIAVANLKRWLPSFAVRLEALETGALQLERVYFPVITAGEETVSSALARFEGRGRYSDEGVRLRTRFPFGFVEREVKLRLNREVLVYPSIELTPRARLILDRMEQRSPGQTIGESHDLYRIRPLESHESARFIDWKASARSGGLWAREYAAEQRLRVRLQLDRRVSAGSHPQAFEDVVDCCAAVVWALRGRQAEISFASDEIAIQARAGRDSMLGILRYLAEVASTTDANAVPQRPRGPDDGEYVVEEFRATMASMAMPHFLKRRRLEDLTEA